MPCTDGIVEEKTHRLHLLWLNRRENYFLHARCLYWGAGGFLSWPCDDWRMDAAQAWLWWLGAHMSRRIVIQAWYPGRTKTHVRVWNAPTNRPKLVFQRQWTAARSDCFVISLFYISYSWKKTNRQAWQFAVWAPHCPSHLDSTSQHCRNKFNTDF